MVQLLIIWFVRCIYCYCRPWPTSGLDFVTQWCRVVKVDLESWNIHLRDFPQPMWEILNLHLWGRLVGAEQQATFRGEPLIIKE